ncbi:MAG: hypothetical protein HZA61_12315 [Candidatus Eisenbacteria bacterium]|uniref:Uncharacterized protein n=1 Tax=Eiseniibacteriota bacterium TaxID=2212470 RepID=A0A933SEI4_UNCEI|nr:hypothetical protein [Candidatus Eisenbacteria bacterium]
MDLRSSFHRPLRLADLLRDPFADVVRRWPRYRTVLPMLLPGTLAAFTASYALPANRTELADLRRIDLLLIVTGMLGAFTAQNIATYQICHIAAETAGDPAPASGALVGPAFRRCLTLTVVAALQILLLVASAVALVVPAFFVAPMLAAAIPACVLEHAGPIESLRRSRSLSEGRRTPCLLAPAALVLLALSPLEWPLQALSAPAWTVITFRVLVNSALHLVFTVQAAQLWCGLRFEKGEYTEGSLAHVFD